MKNFGLHIVANNVLAALLTIALATAPPLASASIWLAARTTKVHFSTTAVLGGPTIEVRAESTTEGKLLMLSIASGETVTTVPAEAIADLVDPFLPSLEVLYDPNDPVSMYLRIQDRMGEAREESRVLLFHFKSLKFERRLERYE